MHTQEEVEINALMETRLNDLASRASSMVRIGIQSWFGEKNLSAMMEAAWRNVPISPFILPKKMRAFPSSSNAN